MTVVVHENERIRWRTNGARWTRDGDRAPVERVRLRVARSTIAGHGLFVDQDVAEGACLGRIYGASRMVSDDKDAAENWAMARRDSRLVLVQSGRRWHVVDARGCAFEYANHSADAPTMHVTPSGTCLAERDLARGTELTWDYGPLHSLRDE